MRFLLICLIFVSSFPVMGQDSVQIVPLPTKEQMAEMLKTGDGTYIATEADLAGVDLEIAYSGEGRFYHWKDQPQPDKNMRISCVPGNEIKIMILKFRGNKSFCLGCITNNSIPKSIGAFRKTE